MRRMAMRKLFLTLVICWVATGWLIGCNTAPREDATTPEPDVAEDTTSESVDFSFVFLGCNRVGWNPDFPTPSTANVPQLTQTLKDIAALEQTAGLPTAPRFLFFLGDLVRNEEDDQGQTLEEQLGDWQTLWENLPTSAGSATQPVLLPGNHEMLASIEFPQSSGTYYEIPNPPTYEIWLNWLTKNGYDGMAGNGPTPETAPEDQLASDNSRQTWSFSTALANGKNVHFVLINTDTLSTARTTQASCLQNSAYATKPLPGWIPAHWIDTDIGQANGDSNTDLIFAFGHKPIQAPGGSSDTFGRSNILNCKEFPLADQLLTTFQTNTKFVGYLASHVHEWNHTELRGEGERQVPQIIAGDGGSPLSGGDIFGFTLVRVFTDGKVTATSYGRDQPEPYDNPDAGGAATPRQTVVLRPANGP